MGVAIACKGPGRSVLSGGSQCHCCVCCERMPCLALVLGTGIDQLDQDNAENARGHGVARHGVWSWHIAHNTTHHLVRYQVYPGRLVTIKVSTHTSMARAASKPSILLRATIFCHRPLETISSMRGDGASNESTSPRLSQTPALMILH